MTGLSFDSMVAVVMNRCEGVQLVMSTVESGHFAGLFTTLPMRHLIPAHRMTVGYLKRIHGADVSTGHA